MILAPVAAARFFLVLAVLALALHIVSGAFEYAGAQLGNAMASSE